MSSINKVFLVGNLGADVEIRYTAGGKAVCTLRVATTQKWKNRDGQLQEKTEWHRVVVWGAEAENAAKYLSKGRQVHVEGSLQTRSWDDKDGNKRYSTEVVASHVTYLGGGRKEQTTEPDPETELQAQEDAAADDIPL